MGTTLPASFINDVDHLTMFSLAPLTNMRISLPSLTNTLEVFFFELNGYAFSMGIVLRIVSKSHPKEMAHRKHAHAV